jgi:hypothetical protein
LSTFDDDAVPPPPPLLPLLPQAARAPVRATRAAMSRPADFLLGMGILSDVEGHPVEALRYDVDTRAANRVLQEC